MRKRKRSVCLWVKGKRLDSADSCSFDGGDSHVSILTPEGVPGVSKDVVVLTVFRAVSDKCNSMVKSGSTGDIIEDTFGVMLEYSLIGFNSDGDWLLNDSCLELRDGVLWYGCIALNLNTASKFITLAIAWNWSNIFIVCLRILSVFLQIFEGT